MLASEVAFSSTADAKNGGSISKDPDLLGAPTDKRIAPAAPPHRLVTPLLEDNKPPFLAPAPHLHTSIPTSPRDNQSNPTLCDSRVGLPVCRYLPAKHRPCSVLKRRLNSATNHPPRACTPPPFGLFCPLLPQFSACASCSDGDSMHPFSILTLGIFVAGYITARWDLVTRLYELAIFAWDYGVVVSQTLLVVLGQPRHHCLGILLF